MISEKSRRPMIFSCDKAFNFLKKNGFVFTFREGQYGSGVEDVWIRRERTGEKEFDAKRVNMNFHSDYVRLENYVEWSGFNDVIEWVNKIQEIHGKGYVTGTVFFVFRA